MRPFTVVALAMLVLPVSAFAQGSRATLQASPSSATVGTSIAFTLTVPASAARSLGLRAGSAMPIRFGDNQSGTMVLSLFVNAFTGRTSHTYAAAGTFTASVASPGAFTTAFSALASTTVTIAAQSKPVPTPSILPTSAPSRGRLLGMQLLWPNGAYHLQLTSGESVPQPVARVLVSASTQIVAQWSVDGKPMQTVTAAASAQRPVIFRYAGALPPGGSHSVGFVVLSPVQSGLVVPTPPPPIGYQYGGLGFATPSPLGTAYTSLHFQGFIVTSVHYSKPGPQQYSGTGAAHIANLSFTVSFSNVTVVPDHCPLSCPGQGAVTAGTAVSAIATPAPQGLPGNRKGGSSGGGGVHRAPSGSNPLAGVGCGGPYLLGFGQFAGGIAFGGQVGSFARYGYNFSLMGALLEPLGTSSQATLCWAPVGVDIASSTDASNGFNNPPPFSFFHALQNQLVLTLSMIQIDQDGQFEDDISGDNVGPYRLGYTPFDVAPTKSQTLQLRFSDTDGAPHAAFNGTPASGPILQQVSPAATNVTVSNCDWSATGINAIVSINSGQSIYVAEPARFKLTISSAMLALQNSFFLGGAMAGAFAANQNAPPSLVSSGGGFRISRGVQSSASTAYQTAAQSAASYNASQQSSSGSHFVRLTHSVPISLFGGGTTDPAGGFSGPFTSSGDLVAAATPGAYSNAGYQITATHASLFVPGGESAYQPDGAFDLMMDVIAAVSPLWSQIPQLNYNPQTGYSWSGSGAFGAGNIIGQLQSGSQSGQGGVRFKAGGSLGYAGGSVQQFGGSAQPVTATPAMPYPGLYIDQGTIQTPSQAGSSTFSASQQGQGFGFAFTGGGGNSGLFSLSAGINMKYGSFPINLQILNVEFLNYAVVKSGAWGVLQIPAPIAATLPIEIEQINPDGSFGTPVVPQNATIALTAWKASLSPNQNVVIGTSSIAIPNATLTFSGTQLQLPAVQGTLQASGTIQNDQLLPLGQIPQTRISGLDFQPQSFSFPANGSAPGISGNGSIAGWMANKALILTLQGNSFAPPSGTQFGVSQSFGVVSMSANISYSGNAWDGSGQIQSADFLNASFSLHVDDQTETGEVGVTVPGGSGNSSSGIVNLAGIAGGARFSRDNGALQALAFGATLNLSAFKGSTVVIYDTSLNDPLVQQASQKSGASIGDLGSRGWNCAQAWCFTGSVAIAIDSNDKLSGNLDGLVNNGFEMYVNGQLQTVLTTVSATGSFGLFNDGEWDLGIHYTPIPIFGVNFDLKAACFWDHHGGQHVQNCLDSGFSETGVGGYIGVGASINLGPIASASADAAVWAGDSVGVGAHLDASGSVGIAGVGVEADASLDLSTSPLGFKGHAHLYACVCAFSLDVSVGAYWYVGQSFGIDDAGLGLGGPCGFCNPSNWF